MKRQSSKLSIKIFDLEFNSDCYYIQRGSIVKKVIFNNRTLYSKFERYTTPLNQIIVEQHLKRELTLALPLINGDRVDYIVLEYQKDENSNFYYMIKHLLKSIYIEKFYTYKSSKEGHIQIFIPRENIAFEEAFEEVEKIKEMLEDKSSKSCKILPNRNLPKNYNITTFPMQKM